MQPIVIVMAVIYTILGINGILMKVKKQKKAKKEQKKQVNESWISQILDVEKVNLVNQVISPINLEIECPVCHIDKMHTFPEDEVNRILNDQRSIVKIVFQKGVICEHSFNAYINRDFLVLGYKTIDSSTS